MQVYKFRNLISLHPQYKFKPLEVNEFKLERKGILYFSFYSGGKWENSYCHFKMAHSDEHVSLDVAEKRPGLFELVPGEIMDGMTWPSIDIPYANNTDIRLILYEYEAYLHPDTIAFLKAGGF